METIVNKEPPDKRTRPGRAAKIKDRKNGEENVVKCTLSRIIADKDNKDVITKVIKERVDSVSKRTYLAGVAVNRILKEVFEGVPDAQLHTVSVPSVDQNFIRQLMVGSRQAHMETRDATVERILAKEFKDEHGIDETVFHRYLLYDIHSWGVKEDLIAIHSLLPERTKMLLKIQHSIIGRDEINRQWLKSVSNSAKMIRYNVFINRYLEATEDEGYAKLVNIAPIPTVKHSFITIDTDGLLGVLKDVGLVESLEKTLTNNEHWESVFDVENIRSTGKGWNVSKMAGTFIGIWEGRMSDFDNCLRQLEADYKVLFEEQANQRQDIQALRDATSTQFQRLDKEIQAMMDWGDVFPDLYDVLDIDEGAVDQEILRAFRIQVVRVHPDKLGPLASEDERTVAALRTRVILQAKNVLLNTESRKEYDSERRMRRQGEQQSKSGFSAPEEASAGMAHVWEVWANVVVEGFAKQFEAGARGERVVQLLETILLPAIGVGLGGERGFKLGLTLSTVFNTGCISVVVKALSAEDQKLFFQALEVLCTKMP
eukprot:gene766-biopygen516